MASLSALSAAIRDRLLADEPAPLPGFGTLRRVHVPARVQAQPDGSRTLRPPSETLRLVLGAEPDPGALAVVLARRMGLPVAGGAAALHQHVEQVEAVLAIKGEVELEGVGILRRTSRGLLFGADPGLLSTINAAYQGLSEVGTTTEAEAVATQVEVSSIEAESFEYPEPVHAEIGRADSNAEPPQHSARQVESELPDATDLPPITSGDGHYSGVDLDAFSIGASDAPTSSALADSLRDEVSEDEAPVSGAEVDREVGTQPNAVEAADTFAEEEQVPETLPTEADLFSIEATDPEEIAVPESSSGLDAWFGATSDSMASPEPTDIETGPEPAELPLAEEVDALPEIRTSAPQPSDARQIQEEDAPNLEEPDPVDELLAGIWTSGTPTTGDLGVSPPAEPEEIEDAEYDLLPESSDRAEASAAAHAFSFDTSTARREAAPEPIGPKPDGLPIMPTGWTPSGDYDDEYEDIERPRGALPWVFAAVAVLALILAAIFLWPRMTANRVEGSAVADAPEEPTAPLTDDALASTLDEETELDLGAEDAMADGSEEEGFDASESAGPPSSASSVAGGSASPAASAPAPRRPTRTLSTESAGSVSATPRAGGNAGRPEVPTRNPLSPDLSGLSDALARALAGDAPIRLDAQGFTWVVSSVSSREEADAFVERYRRAGFRARVIEGAPGGRMMYRIAVGQFDTRQDAYAVRDRLPADIRDREDIWTLNLADA